MMAIDVPVGLAAGQVIADAGRNMLKGGDAERYKSLRSTVILFAYLFTTPIVFYFFMGWPAWETNYVWEWVDHIQGTPLFALSSFGAVIMALLPAWIGFESGKYLIRKDKAGLLRICYISLFILILLIVFVTRNATFNIAPTYKDYAAKNFSSFMGNPFFIYWLILTVYFWGGLIVFYLFIRRKDREQKLEHE
ncbi:MAG: hypothetical protein HY279_14955 [Nitrospinae bacterium]|nr:hypothetical protein [Nitrospinota bacterium]